jgi:hypothetical protein
MWSGDFKRIFDLPHITEHTKRYANSRRGMKPEWRQARNQPVPANGLFSDDKERLLAAMRRYFNLCSEEVFLTKARMDRQGKMECVG